MKRWINIIQLVVIFVLIHGTFAANASEFPKSIQKKIDKEVQKIFPVEDLIMDDIDNLNLDAFNCEGVRDLHLSTLKKADKLMGFACFASSKGKNDFFDYMVLFNENLEIQKVVVLIYRSSYGGEIMAKSWLKQFIGKIRGEEMEFGKDIDGISGATISAPAMAKGVKSVSLLLSELKANGKI
ncbi:FMN-binding protein [Labilibaculum euxinus]|uniref:FMN-binding protein n=1 Tax=Labilibaculum euxinus TaxID=2686357 RepID=A0A7M4D814_9BACT|nr:FMN-binding protein [Labilibaculum euxinus]MUP38793.1 FMN-binding protein [Labilibaculum euxinus]MVB07998.1 FMN-binding protein [Labilibaculum euxinus]